MSLMSFFAKKNAPSATVDLSAFHIKTMQDDIDQAKGIVKQSPAINTPKQSQTTTPQSVKASASLATPQQGPFIPLHQEQVSHTQQPVFSQKEEVLPTTPQPNPLTTPIQSAPIPQPLFKAPQTTLSSPPLTPPVNNNAIPPVDPLPTLPPVQKSLPKLQFMLPLLVLIGIIAIGSIYYFTQTRDIDQELAEVQPATEMPGTPIENNTPPNQEQIFSTVTANYLPIDTNNTTPQLFQLHLSEVMTQVATLQSPKPVEFILTDTTNTPLSFTTFTQISGLTLSPLITEQLQESFSLFVHAEPQGTHVGFAVQAKDPSALQKILREKELYLEQDLSPLFFGITPSQPKESFQDNTYNNTPVRFINPDPPTALAIDYSIHNSFLVLGLSRQTHRGIVDSILSR